LEHKQEILEIKHKQEMLELKQEMLEYQNKLLLHLVAEGVKAA
jgi:hypothetical protein